MLINYFLYKLIYTLFFYFVFVIFYVFFNLHPHKIVLCVTKMCSFFY